MLQYFVIVLMYETGQKNSLYNILLSYTNINIISQQKLRVSIQFK